MKTSNGNCTSHQHSNNRDNGNANIASPSSSLAPIVGYWQNGEDISRKIYGIHSRETDYVVGERILGHDEIVKTTSFHVDYTRG